MGGGAYVYSDAQRRCLACSYFLQVCTWGLFMKLRVRADTIRLRPKRSEVDRIAAGTSIMEETHFPDSVLTYCLDVSDNNDISARFDNGSLVCPFAKIKSAGLCRYR